MKRILLATSILLIALIGCQSAPTPTPTRMSPPAPPIATKAAPPATQASSPVPATSTRAAQPTSPTPAASVRWVDVHTHLTGNVVEMGASGQAVCSSKECLDRTVAALDKFGAQKALLMYPPAPAGAGSAESETEIAQAAQSRPDRFAYIGGGRALNSLIQQAGKGGNFSADLQQRFQNSAKQVVDAGAVAFGETAVLHLSGGPTHAFEETPADSALYLLLADLAAQYDIPIDIHLEAVVSDMPTPDEFQRRSPQNQKTIKANIGAFEKLLDRNTKARIVWAHVGWDHTGDMTVDLVRRLVEKHPNLYIQLRIASGRVAEHSVVDERGNLRAEWLNLIKAHSDRFVLGSDTFYGGDRIDERNLMAHQNFFNQLSPDLARKIGCENAATIYSKAKITCSR